MRPIAPTRGRRHAVAVAVAVAVAPLALGPGEPPGAGPAALAAKRTPTVTVGIRGFAYRPANLTVRRGTKVVFANRDSVRHTATDRGSFDTGRIRAGESASVRLRQSGTYRYHCKIHPGMSGKVVVP